jgi:carbonic anhydrase
MKIMKIAVTACAMMACAGVALASGSKSHWTYEGHEGPEHWGDLAAEYATCASGKMQSPIDLAEVDANGSANYTVEYKSSGLMILNNGHTVQFNIDNGSKLTENGVDYSLLQVHFHAPSEHVMKAEHHPLEAHFVHKSADGVLSVLGVFIDEGAENAALGKVIAHMPKDVAEAKAIAGVDIDVNELLPQDRSIYRYQGSLTTPPCSEGVNWHVLSHSITASKAQIAALSQVLHMNARPAQALNGRLLIAPAN